MGWTYRRVLGEPHVGRLFGAALLSRLGGQMFALALVLQVLDRYGGPELAGIAVFAAYAPGTVVSPLAGAVLDRAGARRGIAVDLLASAALVGALAALPTGSAVPLVLLAGLFSLTNPLGLAGIRTLLPRLVPGPALERANALDIGLYNLVEVTGPVLAGTSFALLGGRVTLALVAALYAGGFVLVAGLPAGDAPAGPPRRRLGVEAVAGVRYVLAHPVLRALVLSYGLYEVAWGVLVVAVPVAAGGAVRAGLLWGVAGAAGIGGALLAGRLLRPGRERAAMVAGALATGLAAAGMAVGGIAALVAGLVLLGLAAGPVNVGLLTLRQRRTDPGWLGRVLAVSISLNVVGEPIGSAAGGFLAAGSTRPAFLAAAAAALLAAATARLLLPAGPDPASARPGSGRSEPGSDHR